MTDAPTDLPPETQQLNETFNLPLTIAELGRPRTGDGLTDQFELVQLYQADQADRADERDLPADLHGRDRQRRTEVLKSVRAGALYTAGDFYHAATVLQHGTLLEHYHLAFELARRAGVAGHPQARWLSAAAMDRWLMTRGLPQRFGTQYVDTGNGWELYRLDPVTDDAERAAWNVPPLAQLEARLDELNEPDPVAPIDMDDD